MADRMPAALLESLLNIKKTPVPPEQSEAFQQAVIDTKLPGILGQRAGITTDLEKLQGLKKEAALPKNKDMSAIMAMADILGNTGGTYSKYYGLVKNDKLGKQIAGLEDLVAGQRKGLAGAELELLKNFLTPAETTTTGVKEEQDKVPKEVKTYDRELLKTKEAQQLKGIINTNNALKKYAAKLKEYGYEFGGEKADELTALRGKVVLKGKEAELLGALIAADIKLMENQAKPTTGIMGGVREGLSLVGLSGGAAGAKKALEIFEKGLQSDFNTAFKSLKAIPDYQKSPLLDEYKRLFESGEGYEGTGGESNKNRLEELRRKQKGG